MPEPRKTTKKTTAKKTTSRRRASDGGPSLTQTERLIRLEEGISGLQQTYSTHLSSISESIVGLRDDVRGLRDRTDEAQYGKDGKPGNVIKIDRLEQSVAQAKLVVRFLMGAVISLVIGGLWALMTDGNPVL